MMKIVQAEKLFQFILQNLAWAYSEFFQGKIFDRRREEKNILFCPDKKGQRLPLVLLVYAHAFKAAGCCWQVVVCTGLTVTVKLIFI